MWIRSLSKAMMDKRGSEFVEASLTLPLLFLTVLSMIGALIFCFQSFMMQCDTQKEILYQVDMERSLYRKVEMSDVFSLTPGGTFQGILTREYTGSFTAIDEAGLLRAGGMVNGMF